MKKQTVKRMIFNSNALMILSALGLMLIANVLILKLYWENLEQKWQNSIQSVVDTTTMENVIKEWTVHQHSFYMILAADVAICIAILIAVSFFFTKRLAHHIMVPVELLEKGANRIQENVLTEKIEYIGEKEFEDICGTFNTMQEHILSEQEKNRKYELARTEMIAGISHDLKTPLTAVRGAIKSVLDNVAKTEEQKEKFLKIAYKRTADTEQLLDRLFYLSKLETGNMPLNLIKIDLAAFLKNYVDEKKSLLSNENTEITLRAESVMGNAEIDALEFKRILDNLIENSQKYANVNPLKINISLKEEENNFLICFSDNGQGIDESKTEFIFDEFYRADESRSKCDGNGLGLYIVKKLVNSMHGNVYAKNDNGLNIYIKLPKAEE